jgi:hypothetical protein
MKRILNWLSAIFRKNVSIIGKVIPVVYGETRIAPDLHWFADFRPVSAPRLYDYPFGPLPYKDKTADDCRKKFSDKMPDFSNPPFIPSCKE